MAEVGLVYDPSPRDPSQGVRGIHKYRRVVNGAGTDDLEKALTDEGITTGQTVKRVLEVWKEYGWVVEVLLLICLLYYLDVFLDLNAMHTFWCKHQYQFFTLNGLAIVGGALCGAVEMWKAIKDLPQKQQLQRADLFMIGLLLPFQMHIVYMACDSVKRWRKHPLLDTYKLGEAAVEATIGSQVQTFALVQGSWSASERGTIFLSTISSYLAIAMALSMFDKRSPGLAGVPGSLTGIFNIRYFLVMVFRLMEATSRISTLALFQLAGPPMALPLPEMLGGRTAEIRIHAFVLVFIDIVVLAFLTARSGGFLSYTLPGIWCNMAPMLELDGSVFLVPHWQYYSLRAVELISMAVISYVFLDTGLMSKGSAIFVTKKRTWTCLGITCFHDDDEVLLLASCSTFLMWVLLPVIRYCFASVSIMPVQDKYSDCDVWRSRFNSTQLALRDNFLATTNVTSVTKPAIETPEPGTPECLLWPLRNALQECGPGVVVAEVRDKAKQLLLQLHNCPSWLCPELWLEALQVLANFIEENQFCARDAADNVDEVIQAICGGRTPPLDNVGEFIQELIVGSAPTHSDKNRDLARCQLSLLAKVWSAGWEGKGLDSKWATKHCLRLLNIIANIVKMRLHGGSLRIELAEALLKSTPGGWAEIKTESLNLVWTQLLRPDYGIDLCKELSDIWQLGQKPGFGNLDRSEPERAISDKTKHWCSLVAFICLPPLQDHLLISRPPGCDALFSDTMNKRVEQLAALRTKIMNAARSELEQALRKLAQAEKTDARNKLEVIHELDVVFQRVGGRLGSDDPVWKRASDKVSAKVRRQLFAEEEKRLADVQQMADTAAKQRNDFQHMLEAAEKRGEDLERHLEIMRDEQKSLIAEDEKRKARLQQEYEKKYQERRAHVEAVNRDAGHIPLKIASRERHASLLLFGCTGAGKSSLANLMLGWEAFGAGEAFGSVTNTGSIKSAFSSDGRLFVIDTIGLGDTRMDEKQVVDSLRDTALQATNGLDSLVYVIKDGHRIQPSEYGLFEFLVKYLWGNDCLPWLRVVITNADALIIADAVARMEWLDRQAQESTEFKHIYDMLNRDPERFVFVENPRLQPCLNEKDAELRLQKKQISYENLKPLFQPVEPVYQDALMRKAQQLLLEKERLQKEQERKRTNAQAEKLKAEKALAEASLEEYPAKEVELKAANSRVIEARMPIDMTSILTEAQKHELNEAAVQHVQQAKKGFLSRAGAAVVEAAKSVWKFFAG
eukprot:TRINITY_DN24278_c0_g1_i1.p1 TRINITY_DN24278_c0_g1~~TRINITY_DN24278_c0_g1_i1.p1  ORF type:complete len:1255 (+),score=234.94 TRINITY_DN24278_c0_g1_i1:36-3767(+)